MKRERRRKCILLPIKETCEIGKFFILEAGGEKSSFSNDENNLCDFRSLLIFFPPRIIAFKNVTQNIFS